jgi:hypothetical protein
MGEEGIKKPGFKTHSTITNHEAEEENWFSRASAHRRLTKMGQKEHVYTYL